MPSTIALAASGFRFVPGVFQYSAGFRIERARFAEPVPLAEGFRRVAAALDAADRPKAAFCACELRSPGPFTEDGFRAFNQQYGQLLTQWASSWTAATRRPVPTSARRSRRRPRPPSTTR